MSNLTYAFRTLKNTPVVSLVAIASLALGIGANTAIFSVFDQLLLQRLPVHRPDRLVNLTANGPRMGSNSNNVAGNSSSTFSYAMFRDLEKQQSVFTGLAAHCEFGANLAYKGQSLSGDGMFVSGSYFPVLEAVPAAGRLFSPDDDRTPGAHRLVVLSNRFWTTQFNRDPSVLNNTMLVDGIPMTIIGVAPEGFNSTTLGAMPNVFVPISVRETLQPGWKGFDNRRSYWVYLFARLKEGVSRDQGQATMSTLFHGIIESTDLPLQKGMSDRTRERFRNQVLMLEEGSRGQSEVLEQGKAPLTILLAITGFVLLIACANIANLLLARAAGRAREISVRLAIGARRIQLVRQLLTESVLLGVTGALAGLLVSNVTIRMLVSFLPPEAGVSLSPEVNPRSLAFALAASVATGILFGIFPAMHSTRQEIVTAIKDDAGSVSSSGSAARFRKVLVVGQISLSLLLLISAGLFLKSLVNITRVDIGLRTEGVLTFGLAPDRNQYKPDQTRDFYQRLEESIRAIPGVEHATVSLVPLLTDSNWGTSISIDGFSKGPDTDDGSKYNEVGPGFFRALNVPILAGREFTASDGMEAPKVAVVNEAFVRKFSPSENVLGKRMSTGSNQGKNDIEVVGIAHDTKYSQVKDPPPPLVYLPYRQDKNLGSGNFYVVVHAMPAADIGPSVRRAVASLDPNLPLADMLTFEKQVENNVFVDRMVTSLATAFAVLATLLAAVGLYGVLAYSIARRTREIGIRLAIGADPSGVRAMVLKEVGVMAAIGVLIGAPAAVVLAKFAESQLFGIKSYDPMVILAATALIGAVALAAGYFPARVAMGVSPQAALRHD
jgi:predicted permease